MRRLASAWLARRLVSTRAAAATSDACCAACSSKRSNLSRLKTASLAESRMLLAELAVCCKGLSRDEMVSVVRSTASRNHLGLARQGLAEMTRRDMRPSLWAHNAVLETLAREGRWADSTQLLLRMQQMSLQPDEDSYAATIRSAVGVPGSARFAREFLPELRALPPSALSSRGLSHPQSVLLARLGTDSEGSVGMLTRRLLDGAPLDARMFRAALVGCTRQRRGLWREALELVRLLERWLDESGGGIKELLQDEQADLERCFAAAIAACDQGRRRDEALALLDRAEACGVRPSLGAYNAAISACRHDGGDVEAVRDLGRRMVRYRVHPDVWSYNAMLAVLAARGGMGAEALRLLGQLHARQLRPDRVSYGTVLSACRPTPAQAAVLLTSTRTARADATTAAAGGACAGAAAAAAAAAAGADASAEVVTTTKRRRRARATAQPADAGGGRSGGAAAPTAEVARSPGAAMAASSAGAVGAAGAAGAEATTAPWVRALELLPEMRLRGLAPDVRIYGAALELCALSVRNDDTTRLLAAMDADGVRPNGHCLVSAAKASARAADAASALRVVRRAEVGGRLRCSAESAARLHAHAMAATAAAGAPLPLTLALLVKLRRHGVGLPPVVCRAALHACGVQGVGGAAPARRLLREMQSRKVEVCDVALTGAMRACAAEDGWEAAAYLLREVRGEGAAPPAQLHGKFSAESAVSSPPPTSPSVEAQAAPPGARSSKSTSSASAAGAPGSLDEDERVVVTLS